MGAEERGERRVRERTAGWREGGKFVVFGYEIESEIEN